MTVGAIVAATDGGELAQLGGIQQAVRNRDAQHWREALNVQAIAQAQRTVVILREFTGEVTTGLIAKLRDSLIDQRLVS